MVAKRLIKSNPKSDSKSAVLIFDKIVEVGCEVAPLDNALDHMFAEFNPLAPQVCKSIPMCVNLQRPHGEHDSKLFSAMTSHSVAYARNLADSILSEILKAEELDAPADSSLSERVNLMKSNEDAFVYNASFLSQLLLLQNVQNLTPRRAFVSLNALCNFFRTTSLDEMRDDELLNIIFGTFERIDFRSVDEDEFDLLIAAVSLFLEDLDGNSRTQMFPLFNIKTNGTYGI